MEDWCTKMGKRLWLGSWKRPLLQRDHELTIGSCSAADQVAQTRAHNTVQRSTECFLCLYRVTAALPIQIFQHSDADFSATQRDQDADQILSNLKPKNISMVIGEKTTKQSILALKGTFSCSCFCEIVPPNRVSLLGLC